MPEPDRKGNRVTTAFDDYEPEDSWHPDDPVPEQIVNLRRRLALLLDSDDHADTRNELNLYRDMLTILRWHRRSPRNELRADDLATDIDHVVGRL